LDIIYRNKRWRRCRFLQIVFWGATFFFIYLAWITRNGNDPRNNNSASLILVPILFVFSICLEAYLWHYITVLSRTSTEYTIETLTTFGRRTLTYLVDDVKVSDEFTNKKLYNGVRSSYYLVIVKGHLPFIADVTEGDVIDSICKKIEKWRVAFKLK